MSQAGLLNSSSNGGGNNPNQTITDFDDMLGTDGLDMGKLHWGVTGAWGLSTANGTATHPGIFAIELGAVGQGAVFPNQGTTDTAPFVLGQGTLSINFVFDLVALSDGVDTYTVFIGLMDGTSLNAGTPPTDGCYFKYTNSVNSGNWQIECQNTGVATTGNTTTAASTGFHNYGIQINAAGTSVAFYIDGVQVSSSPLATNIPTVQLNPAIFIDVTAGAPTEMLFDLFYYQQVLNTAR